MSSGSSTTGTVLGLVGAVVGGYFGGPAGASAGYAIGSGVGNMLDPPKGPTIEGPRLDDLTVQTSTYGAAIPRTDGTIGVSGNVFWLENNKIKERVKKKSSGGKGGGSSSTIKTYTYYATFAVGLCEGPIAGVRRIWVGPDLIYNAGSDDLETIIASNQAAKGFSVYTGTEDQQPDPRMQAEMGVANCPAYRGLAYIVLKDLALAKYGNSVAGAQVKVEVVSVSSSSSPSMYSAMAAAIGTTKFQVGHAGDNGLDPVYGGWLYGPDALQSLSKKGLVSNFDVTDIAVDFRPHRNYTATDRVRSLWIHETQGTRSMAALTISGIWEYYASAYDFTAFEFYERSNDIWVSWTDDTVSPDPATPGFGWYAKVHQVVIDGIINISYSHKTQLAVNDLCAVNGYGDFVYTEIAEIPELSTGYASISIIDEFGSVVSSGVVSISPSFGSVSGDSSACYVDDFNNLHIVMSVYRIGGASPEGWKGYFYHVKIDLSSMTLVHQRMIFVDDLDHSFLIIGSVRVVDGMVYVSGVHLSFLFWRATFADSVISDDVVSLASIVSAEIARSALIDPIDVVTSELSDSVIGFKVSQIGSIRNAIEPLRGAWPFDVVQSGYLIKAKSRGTASVVTIPSGDLLIDSVLEESREMNAQLPKTVQIKYLDRGRDYDANEQRSDRATDETVNTLALDLPVVLTADQAAQVSEKLLYIYWLERSDFSFKLPPPYRYLEPADVVTIVTEYASYELRLSTVNYESDGTVGCTAKANNAAAYTSIAEGGSGITAPGTVPLAGSTYAAALDIPVVDETLQNAPGFVVAMTGETEGWPGGILYRTEDGGQTWEDLQAFAGKCVFGSTKAPLATNACNLIQKGGSLIVELIAGSLESVTESQMLNGSNLCAYGADGRWEIMRFQNAALNGDGTYTLDTFWRGDKGTEWTTGLHATGDTFVLLTDPDNAFVDVSLDSIGAAKTYRAVTAGADIGSASDQPFTYAGVNLECLSPVHAKGVRDGSSNLTATWQRRTRIGGAWRDYVDATLGETVEAYEIDVMSGATVVRTITSATQSATYSAADQTTDFGAPQSSITLRIYQMSDKVGRGYPLEATL